MAPPSNSDDADYDPGVLPLHPLIRGLAVGLKEPGNLVQAKLAAGESSPADTAPQTTGNEISTEALETFAGPRRAQVVMFAGYLGPTQTDPADAGRPKQTWRLLYRDETAATWLMVPEDAIILHQRAPDKKAAFQLRDVIWVKADAPVRQGEQAESRQARFLVGTFTAAGDLRASLTDASALSPGSGILCAPTPECCMRHSR